jgi:hypothetical protein
LVKTKNLPCHFEPSGVRKNFVKEELPEKGFKRRPLVVLLNLPSRGLHQLSVLDA